MILKGLFSLAFLSAFMHSPWSNMNKNVSNVENHTETNENDRQIGTTIFPTPETEFWNFEEEHATVPTTMSTESFSDHGEKFEKLLTNDIAKENLVSKDEKENVLKEKSGNTSEGKTQKTQKKKKKLPTFLKALYRGLEEKVKGGNYRQDDLLLEPWEIATLRGEIDKTESSTKVKFDISSLGRESYHYAEIVHFSDTKTSLGSANNLTCCNEYNTCVNLTKIHRTKDVFLYFSINSGLNQLQVNTFHGILNNDFTLECRQIDKEFGKRNALVDDTGLAEPLLVLYPTRKLAESVQYFVKSGWDSMNQVPAPNKYSTKSVHQKKKEDVKENNEIKNDETVQWPKFRIKRRANEYENQHKPSVNGWSQMHTGEKAEDKPYINQQKFFMNRKTDLWSALKGFRHYKDLRKPGPGRWETQESRGVIQKYRNKKAEPNMLTESKNIQGNNRKYRKWQKLSRKRRAASQTNSETTDDKTDENAQEKQEEETTNEKAPCQLHQWSVSGEDLGTGDADVRIVEPERLEVGFCRGVCNIPEEMTVNARLRERYKIKLEEKESEKAQMPSPCCVPDHRTLQPQTIIRDTGKVFKTQHIPEFRASSCKCV